MSEKKIKEHKGKKKQLLLENPYDLETFFESLSISSENEKELLFVDRLIAGIRLDPEVEITELSYKILTELKLMNERN